MATLRFSQLKGVDFTVKDVQRTQQKNRLVEWGFHLPEAIFGGIRLFALLGMKAGCYKQDT
jgi:hypothetical protein